MTAALLAALILGSPLITRADDCADLNKKNMVARAGSSIGAFPWSVVSNKDVVLLGDEHTATAPANLLRVIDAITQSIATPRRLCLFMEFPKSLPLTEFKRLLKPGSDIPTDELFRQYNEAIVDGAEARGLDVHLVDHENNREEDVPLNQRDEAIAKNISGLLNEGTCDRGILLIGKAHITPDEPGRKLVAQQLNELSRTSVTVNIQNADEKLENDQLKSWNGLCSSAREPLPSPLVFSNYDLKSIPLYPRYSPLTLMGYFDFTVLFP